MRAELSAAFLLLTSGVPSQAAAAPATLMDIQTVEARVGEAIGRKDVGSLERLWAPDMLVNGPSNVVLTREQVIAALLADRLTYSSYRNDVENFQAYGDDLAAIMGHEILSRADGQQRSQRLYRRYTDVWRRSGGTWVQIVRQATYTTEPTD